MKTKSFDEYLAKRLNKKEIEELEQQADTCYKFYKEQHNLN